MTYLEQLQNKRRETEVNKKIDENHKQDILKLIDMYIKEAKEL